MDMCLAALSVFFAAIGGTAGGLTFLLGRNDRVRRRAFRRIMGVETLGETTRMLFEVKGLGATVIAVSLRRSIDQRPFVLPANLLSFWGFGLAGVETLIEKTGLEGSLDKRGIVEARVLFSIFAGLVGLLVGSAFSEVLMLVFGFVGFVWGYTIVVGSLRREARERAFVVERQLSQMLEVTVLGLRSGLSFDRSFEFYHRYFTGDLSRRAASVQGQWRYGLSTREEGMRALARAYDSALFERVAESIIRSLRFGTSLAETLSILSAEARSIRKSKIEERVAKAPVKMLVPVGALILPAMLILIMGPVLLDLMEGF